MILFCTGGNNTSRLMILVNRSPRSARPNHDMPRTRATAVIWLQACYFLAPMPIQAMNLMVIRILLLPSFSFCMVSSQSPTKPRTIHPTGSRFLGSSKCIAITPLFFFFGGVGRASAVGKLREQAYRELHGVLFNNQCPVTRQDCTRAQRGPIPSRTVTYLLRYDK